MTIFWPEYSSHPFISNSIQQGANDYPTKEVVITGQRRLSYKDMCVDISMIYQQLIRQGIQPLEKIAWTDSGSHLFIEFLCATELSQAVSVPLNPGATVQEWAEQCMLCHVSTLLVPAAFAEKAQATFLLVSSLQRVFLLEIRDNQPFLVPYCERTINSFAQVPNHSEPGDVLILCSSGSTGRPKGIVLTSHNLLANQKSLIDYMGVTHKDIMLVCKALFHSSTVTEMLAVIHAHGSLIISPWLTARGALAQVRNEQATMLCIVPTMAREMIQAASSKNYRDLQLNVLSVSGSPLSASILLALAEQFPHCKIYHAYGLTEASPRVSALLSHELFQHPESIGRTIINVHACVVDSDDNILPTGHVGELVVNGANVMRAYYGDPTATVKALRSPGLHTGDLASIDEQGYMYLHGRKDDLINCGGQKIYPLEIERILLQHPAIAEALVQGEEDERLGSFPVARVVLVPGAVFDEKAIKEYCFRYLAVYKVPRQIVSCPELPRTATGKVRRHGN